MPAGYQITQQDHPVAHSGFFEFYVHCNDEASVFDLIVIFHFSFCIWHKWYLLQSFVPYKKRVNILRIQLEHDSGRTIHDLSNNRSLIDLNRAG